MLRVEKSVKLGNMQLCAVESGYVAMSSSAARKARIGEKVFPQEKQRGSARINVATLTTLRKIILADYVGTPTRARARTPPIASQTEGDIAVFQSFIYGVQLH